MHEPIIDAIARDDFKALLVGTLEEDYHTTFERASVKELYKTIAEIINEQLQKKKWSWNRTRRDIERTQLHRKKIYYISMEFLMGQSLKNNLYNLGETELVASVLAERGLTLEEIFECEPDAGLGKEASEGLQPAISMEWCLRTLTSPDFQSDMNTVFSSRRS